MKERLVPIAQSYKQSDRIRLLLPFPDWVDTDHIGINLSKTERFMNLGGIRHVRLVGSWDEDGTVTMPTGIGMAPDGSRYVGLVRAKEEVKSDAVELQKDPSFHLLKNSEWTGLTIHVNLREIERRIWTVDGNLRHAASWSPFLDQSLRDNIRKTGTHHLLRNRTLLQNGCMVMANFSSLVFGPKIIDLVQQWNTYDVVTKTIDFMIISFIPIIWGSWTFAIVREEGREAGGHGYRISLFPGYEIDRAALLQVLSRTQKLVKPIEKN